MTDALFLMDFTAQPSEGDVLQLSAATKRHAVQSMRMAAGDNMQLSDGRGLRVRATLSDADTGEVRVEQVERENVPAVKLILVQALAKTGHDEQAIDMATQIGVDEVIPWQADRSIAKWKDGRTDRKWDQLLDAATEQSRRAWKPELGQCVTSKQLTAWIGKQKAAGNIVVVLHQDATDTWDGVETAVAKLRGDARGAIAVIVGPEGGISEQEVVQFVEVGAVSCVLGKNILRAATAGPVALSLLARALGRFA